MTRRPNVLFLMSDHTNAQALAPGSQCQTPNLDALAAEGRRFHRCTTTNAICSPARASLLTGTYPSTHGVWDCTHVQHKRWVDIEPGLAHWARHLAAAGYRNGYFGKWHADQSNRPQDFGWHEVDLSCSDAKPAPVAGTEVVARNPGYRDYLLATEGEDDPGAPGLRHPAYDRGIDFIRQAAGEGQPFCCFISTGEPHDAYVPPGRFLRLYDIDRIQPSPTLRDELTGKPEVLKRMRDVWKDLSDRDWKMVSACYWATISFLDHEVGRAIDALCQAGVHDDTIIVFTSDHGDMLGGHGLATKGVGTAYEEVYNIPLILRVPGEKGTGSFSPSEKVPVPFSPGAPKQRGQTPFFTQRKKESVPFAEDHHTYVSLVDLGPTLLDYCSAEPLPKAQGRSLRPVLEGSADPADWEDAYAEFFSQRFGYTQRIVWHGRWKFIFSPGGIDELYDLAADPHERTNLADLPAHRPTLLETNRRMWRKMKEIDDWSLFNTGYASLRTAVVGPLEE